jgi:hypothetical protein
MVILLVLFILGAGFYSSSYGIYLWKTEKKKLSGFGVLLISLMGVVVPIVAMFIMM